MESPKHPRVGPWKKGLSTQQGRGEGGMWRCVTAGPELGSPETPGRLEAPRPQTSDLGCFLGFSVLTVHQSTALTAACELHCPAEVLGDSHAWFYVETHTLSSGSLLQGQGACSDTGPGLTQPSTRVLPGPGYNRFDICSSSKGRSKQNRSQLSRAASLCAPDGVRGRGSLSEQRSSPSGPSSPPAGTGLRGRRPWAPGGPPSALSAQGCWCRRDGSSSCAAIPGPSTRSTPPRRAARPTQAGPAVSEGRGLQERTDGGQAGHCPHSGQTSRSYWGGSSKRVLPK